MNEDDCEAGLWIVTLGAVLTASPRATPRTPRLHRRSRWRTLPLLTINATLTQDGLALHVLHANNQIPIDGRDVTVSVDGKNQPLTVEPEGTFLLPTKDLGEGLRQFDITVAHDGIREILTGKVTIPKTRGVADGPLARPQTDGVVDFEYRDRADRGTRLLTPARRHRKSPTTRIRGVLTPLEPHLATA